MRIIRISIDGFGTLSGFSRDFNDGLNCIEEDNGWGKSTLATFMKSMFFGLENRKVLGVTVKERERFKPWNGGVFGGSIEFETGGREYLLKRTFGAREKDDSFALYDKSTMLESKDYSANIGKELFGIDSESFMRTLFIGQEDIDSTATDDVKTRLANLGGLSLDMGRYPAAVASLDEGIKAVGGRGKDGEIRLANERITRLSKQVNGLAAVDAAIAKTTALRNSQKTELDSIKQRIVVLTAEQKAAAEAEGLREKKKRYDELLRAKEDKDKKLAEREDVFAGNIPQAQELAARASEAEELRRNELDLDRLRLTDEENAFLDAYAPMYAMGVPSDEVMERARGLVRQLAEKEKEFASLQFSQEEKTDFEIYSSKFKGRGDVGKEAADAINRWNGLSALEGSMDADRTQLLNVQEVRDALEKSASKTAAIVLIACGIVVLIAGVFMGRIVTSGLGALVACIGAAMFFAGIIANDKRRKRIAELDEQASSLSCVVIDEHTKIREGRDAIREFVVSMELPSDDQSILDSLIKLKTAYGRYVQLLEKDQDERDDRLAAEMDVIRGKLSAFLLPYSQIFAGIQDDSDKLTKLGIHAEKYRTLKARRDDYQRGLTSISAEKEPLLAYARQIGHYGGEADISKLFAKIMEDFRAYQSAYADSTDAGSQLARFLADTDLTKLLNAGAYTGLRSLDQIDSELKDCNASQEKALGHLHEYNANLDDLLQQKDEIDAASAELAEENAHLAELNEKLRLLTEARSLLETAHTGLINRYRQPIEDGFRRYYALFGGDAKDFVVDAGINLSVAAGGMLRSPSAFSSGSQDRINLCMRMGLIDAMYKGDKPFVVMDDPFTNLDNERLEGGKEMIRTLAKDRQVIYLTCHDSRAI